MRVRVQVDAEVNIAVPFVDSEHIRERVEDRFKHVIRAILQDATLWPDEPDHRSGRVLGLVLTVLSPEGR